VLKKENNYCKSKMNSDLCIDRGRTIVEKNILSQRIVNACKFSEDVWIRKKSTAVI